MRSFKVLIASAFFVVALNAQDVAVSEVPDFYHLENLESETIFVHACLGPREDGGPALGCAVVAELTKPELMSFLLSQQNGEGKARGEGKNYYKRFVGSVLLGAFVIAIAEIWEFRWLRFPGGTFVLLGAAFGLTEIFQGEGGAEGDLADHIRSGIIGGSSQANREILEKFTDFLNNRASAGIDFASETVLAQ